MKQTENNEMDLLLRNLARREGSRSVLGESSIEDHLAHLNADELNAYAERALPAAARARYTKHLADCTRCRKIVSELTASAAVSVGESRVEREAPTSFWQKLSAFFSPAVLRYAIPAVLLFAVVGVTFVAFRQQRQSRFVAQNEPAAARSAVAEDKRIETPSADRASENSARKKPSDENQGATGLYLGKDSKPEEKAETAKARIGETAPVTSEKDAGAGKGAGTVTQPAYSPEPAAPPPAKPGVWTAEAKTEQEARKEQPTNRDAIARQQEDERTRNKVADKEEQLAASKTTVASAGGRNMQGLRRDEPKRSESAGSKKSDDDAEIRSVGGRRFRRQGSLWVDTAYQASAATTVVARGSEQYRALVADEPGIGTIADQLQGEVIIVWKGRAYRIR
ncbi:MAG: hypothetical protein ACREBG_23435 [Pyrinomonadaceae bacterium]